MRERLRRVHAASTAYLREWKLFNWVLPTAFLFGVFLFLCFYLTFGAPEDFSVGTLLKVPKGSSVEQTAELLKERHLIRSTWIFVHLVDLYSGKNAVMPGEYFFPGTQSAFTVARRVARGDYQLIPVKVRIPEGANSTEIAAILSQKIVDFDKEEFIKEARPKEGYLFPDTYFFLPGQDPDKVIYAMTKNFDNHMARAEVAQALKVFGKPLSEIIIMASLLEEEAPHKADRQVIAGILWKRISINMPLQVDAVFPYFLGKNSFELTRADLKIDSPYNTYVHKGLPVGPISNPGLDAIMAAMTPTKTNYLFYLSDMQSQFHYSVTYKQQLANQRLYLPH